MPVEQQLRDLRHALQRLAAAVMWRDGVPMPQVVKGTLETLENTSKERISERTQVVDVTVPQIMEELQDRIPERMYERVRGCASAYDRPSTRETKHAEFPQIYYIDKSCRYACGDAVTGPSDSDGFED